MARTSNELLAAEIVMVEELNGIANNSVIYKDNSGVYQRVALGAANTVLTSQGATSAPTFSTNGTGDVTGPASATDSVPVLYDGTTGKLIKNSTPTGTGNPVLQTSPTLTTPVLGVATATSVNKVAITAPATSATLTIADGATLTASATATVSGTNTGDQTSVSGNAGTATALQTARAIYGNNFDGTAALTQVIASTYGGTGNGFTKFTGPTTAEKTFTLPDASSTIVVQGGALGTPSSGTLTNCTGLPVSGITASTSTAIGVGSIELGHATDTTIARVSAGVISVEGATIPTLSATNTWTGVQTIPQVISSNNAITASGNAATVPVTSKVHTVTNNSAATLTITMTTASAVDRQTAIVCILDASAAAQTITWVNTENSTVSAPTTSNGSTTLPLTVGFMYNAATSKWRCVASA